MDGIYKQTKHHRAAVPQDHHKELLSLICNSFEETAVHLILHSNKIWEIWSRIIKWYVTSWKVPIFTLYEHWPLKDICSEGFVFYDVFGYFSPSG